MELVQPAFSITRTLREEKQGHRGAVLWFTGLSGSGKSTLSNAIDAHLHHLGYRTFVLDGDNIRQGLCADLGFSAEDRTENIRRVGEVAKLFLEAGSIVSTAFISPFRADRLLVRQQFADADFIEVHCNAQVEICEARDVKGLYRKARLGLIPDFTGISSPYEPPETPEIILDTATQSIDDCVDQVLSFLKNCGILA